jgi:hypothetical protein
MHSSSERQRMVNPRKAYPVDQGTRLAALRGNQLWIAVE